MSLSLPVTCTVYQDCLPSALRLCLCLLLVPPHKVEPPMAIRLLQPTTLCFPAACVACPDRLPLPPPTHTSACLLLVLPHEDEPPSATCYSSPLTLGFLAVHAAHPDHVLAPHFYLDRKSTHCSAWAAAAVRHCQPMCIHPLLCWPCPSPFTRAYFGGGQGL